MGGLGGGCEFRESRGVGWPRRLALEDDRGGVFFGLYIVAVHGKEFCHTAHAVASLDVEYEIGLVGGICG